MKKLSFPMAFLMALPLAAGCLQSDDEADDAFPSSLDGGSPGSDDLGFEPGDGSCMSEEPMNAYGLCICDAFEDVGRLRVERAQPDMPASVGVNGFTHFVNDAVVQGSWHGHEGIEAVSFSTIEGDVVTVGDFSLVGEQTVGRDLRVGGDLFGVGTIHVGGALAVGGETKVVGLSEVTSEEAYSAPAGPPCPCDATSFFDVDDAVAQAAADNDNALVGLSDDGFFEVGSSEIVLPTGRFYLADLAQVGELKLSVEGQAALYVDGDLTAVGADQIAIADGASLDLYVAGTVTTVGQLDTGSPETAASFRLLIGGEDAVMLNVGQQAFYGHIYAPTAALQLVGQTVIHGSLFVDRVEGVGDLTIRHASAETPPGEVCAPPETPK